MPSVQRYLPVIEEGKPNNIMGMIDLGENVSFDGDETEQEITTAAGAYALNLAVVTPPASTTARNPWFMAAQFTHEEVYNQHHRMFDAFVSIEDVAPSAQHTSGSGLPNRSIWTDGLLLDALSRPNGFAQGLGVPVNTVIPEITGTPEVGETLTTDEGTWTESPTEYQIQWQIDEGSGFADIPGANAVGFTTVDAGDHRVAIIAVNAFGESAVAYSDPVTVVTP